MLTIIIYIDFHHTTEFLIHFVHNIGVCHSIDRIRCDFSFDADNCFSVEINLDLCEKFNAVIEFADVGGFRCISIVGTGIVAFANDVGKELSF